MVGLFANSQTRLTNNPVLVINAGNSVTCSGGGIITVDNSFYHVYDLDNYPTILDTAFVVRMYVGCEETIGGPYNIVGKVHKLLGAPSILNLAFISDDTVAIYPDSSMYRIKIPFTEGYVLPSDSIVAELHLPANTTASFYPASNTSPESNPTYIVATGCAINDFTTMAAISFPSMHLIMNLYVNQKPNMTGISSTVFKNDTLDYLSTDFTNQFLDNDLNDGLTMVKVVTIPSNGVLDLSGTTLIVGDTVMTTELDMLKYIPSSGYSGTDNFSVRAADTTHWSNTPSMYDITVYNWAVSVAELENSDLSIYPNPANSQINIQIAEPILQVRVINAQGKVIFTRISDETIVDVTKLSSGNYFIEVKTDKGISLHQFIKQ